jgi:hypothetical protein
LQEAFTVSPGFFWSAPDCISWTLEWPLWIGSREVRALELPQSALQLWVLLPISYLGCCQQKKELPHPLHALGFGLSCHRDLRGEALVGYIRVSSAFYFVALGDFHKAQLLNTCWTKPVIDSLMLLRAPAPGGGAVPSSVCCLDPPADGAVPRRAWCWAGSAHWPLHSQISWCHGSFRQPQNLNRSIPLSQPCAATHLESYLCLWHHLDSPVIYLLPSSDSWITPLVPINWTEE